MAVDFALSGCNHVVKFWGCCMLGRLLYLKELNVRNTFLLCISMSISLLGVETYCKLIIFSKKYVLFPLSSCNSVVKIFCLVFNRFRSQGHYSIFSPVSLLSLNYPVSSLLSLFPSTLPACLNWFSFLKTLGLREIKKPYKWTNVTETLWC